MTFKLIPEMPFDHWLHDGNMDVIVDDLFYNEKLRINGKEYYYRQLSNDNIVIVANPKNVDKFEAADKNTVQMKAPLNIKVVELQNPQRKNEFACPHFSCGREAVRPMILNARGEAYSHCTFCGGDIRIRSLK
jgi:hypothetical protein